MRKKIMKVPLKYYLSVVGTLLMLVSIVFVINKLRVYWSQMEMDFLIDHAGLIISLIIAYTIINFFLFKGWDAILKTLSVNIDCSTAYKIYARSQLARYIPGNIFHLASRQVIGQMAGIEKYALAKSMMIELGLICLSGILMTFIFFIFQAMIWHELFLFLIAMSLLFWLLHRIHDQLIFAMLWQLLFLFSTGFFFYLLNLSFGIAIPLLLFIGGYVFAWLIGLIVPGAPAGIGIREAVILLLLSEYSTESSLLVSVLVMRVISTLADTLTFLTSYCIKD